MALAEAWSNVRSNYRFHAALRGGRASRLAYLTFYFAIFILFRRGDRHRRALDLHTAFDPLYSITSERDYEREPGFTPAPGQVVMDLGANLGVFATRAAKRVGPAGRVIAVEPHPENFRRLQGNARSNGLDWLQCVQAAAGDRDGEVQLFVHERGINHSIVRGSGRSLTVPMKTVDSIVKELAITRLDILKIDIEGAVPAALRGASETLRRLRPLIALERDSDAENTGLDQILKEHNYVRKDVSVFIFARPA